MRQELCSSELFAAVVQHQILFLEQISREGDCQLCTVLGVVLGAGTRRQQGGSGGGGLSSAYLLIGCLPSPPGHGMGKQSWLRLSLSPSSSWKLSASPSALRPVAASVSRCHFGSASAGRSCSCRHPSPIASPVRFTTVELHILSACAPARWSPQL